MRENGRINLGAREHRLPAGFRHSLAVSLISLVSIVHLSAFSQLNFDPHEAHSLVAHSRGLLSPRKNV